MTTKINPFERLAPEDGSANIHHFINGRLRIGSSQRYCDVFNPARGLRSGRVALATKSEVEEAIVAAAKAFGAWSRIPAVQRSRILFRFRELVERETARLAASISAEHGKILEDARGEVVRGMEVVEFACGIAQLLKGEFSEQVSTDVKRVQALGGAKNHMVVLPDADLDQAVDALLGAAYGSAGERCMAISVAIAVGDRLGDCFVEALAPREGAKDGARGRSRRRDGSSSDWRSSVASQIVYCPRHQRGSPPCRGRLRCFYHRKQSRLLSRRFLV